MRKRIGMTVVIMLALVMTGNLHAAEELPLADRFESLARQVAILFP